MLKSIQILRAIAALLVVFAHFELTKPAIGGFGVDIFFVISGFIMAYIVDRGHEAFLYRRLVRILPLYYVMTFLTTGLFLVKPTWFRSLILTPGALIQSLLFIPYRIKGSGPILSLGWTLNYEMFFYLSIAACIALFGTANAMRACFAWLILLVGSTAAFQPAIHVLSFVGNSIVLEFVGGGLLYYFWQNHSASYSQRMKNGMILAGTASLIMLVLTDYLYDPAASRFLIFGVPAILIANGALMLESRIDQRKKFHSILILLGDASYAMYLVHPFVIYAFLRLIFNRLNIPGLMFQIVGLVLAMLVVCVVSIVLHKYFEKPTIRLLKARFDKRFEAPKSACKS